LQEATDPILPKAGTQKKTTRFATWFAVVFILGFGIALMAMAGMQWSKPCDKPMTVYLLLHGIAALFGSVFFMVVEVMYMDSTDPENDGSLKGRNLQIFFGVVLYFLITGAVGSSWFFASESCEDTSLSTFRWTWAAILLYLIMTCMMFSDVFGKLGGPMFAKVGHVLGSIFQVLADFFNTVADVLDEGPKDPENIPPKRSAAAVFAVYVNHAAFLWFFLYIFFEAYKERKLPCDKPLKTFLYVFSIFGVFITYCHFMFELFAGVKTREKLSKKKFMFIGLAMLLTLIWGLIGFVWVRTSETCREEGNAQYTYRLSYLLSICFLIFCGLTGVFGCMGILDFLCSGRMRFVVVISTGDDNEDDDLQS